MRMIHRGYLYESVSVTDTPAFKAWFGNSKIVDSNGHPIEVYHGSTRDFNEFLMKHAEKEGYFGAGFYFSDEFEDVNANYADSTGGPDAVNKVERIYERLSGQDVEDTANEIGEKLSGEGYEFSEDDLKKIRAYAERQVYGDTPAPNVMIVYLKIENPFYADERKTWIDYELSTEEDEDGDIISEEETGLGVKLLEIIDRIGARNDIPVDDIMDKIRNSMYEDGGISGEELSKLLRNNEIFLDSELGNNVLRDVILGLGFDGVIMSASVFKSMVGTRYATHYIVYNSNQVKSVFNKNPTSDNRVDMEASA